MLAHQVPVTAKALCEMTLTGCTFFCGITFFLQQLSEVCEGLLEVLFPGYVTDMSGNTSLLMAGLPILAV